MLRIDGRDLPLRPNLGLLAQPFSCIGLPIVTVPVLAPGELPIGVQIVASPWREDLALRAAAHLEYAEVALARRQVEPVGRRRGSALQNPRSRALSNVQPSSLGRASIMPAPFSATPSSARKLHKEAPAVRMTA